MADGMFDLREWEYSKSTESKLIDVPVLGLSWNLQKDMLSINADYVKDLPGKQTVITKRLILSITQRVFDPTTTKIAFTDSFKLGCKSW